MRNRLLPSSLCCVLLLQASSIAADDRQRGASDTASLKITFTIPQRIQATAHVATGKLDNAGCLVTGNASSIAVNAVVEDQGRWRLQEVERQAPGVSATSACDTKDAVRFAIAEHWYGDDGIVTLVVSPL